MEIFKIFLSVLMIISAVAILLITLKSGKLIKAFLLNCLLGIALIIIINLISPFSGMKIPVNEYTVPFISLLGIPAISLILVLPLIFSL